MPQIGHNPVSFELTDVVTEWENTDEMSPQDKPAQRLDGMDFFMFKIDDWGGSTGRIDFYDGFYADGRDAQLRGSQAHDADTPHSYERYPSPCAYSKAVFVPTIYAAPVKMTFIRKNFR